MSLEVLNKVIDSNNFTVGGGSASALAGAMAAGMVSMVSKLSVANPIELTAQEYEKISLEADELAKKLLEGSENDTKAYCLIKDAFAMPKKSDEQKKSRTLAIRTAAKKAAEVPRDNGYMCKRVNELANNLIGKSNQAASSDLLSALYLSEAGVKGCVLNIIANLPLIKNEELEKAFKNDVAYLEKSNN